MREMRPADTAVMKRHIMDYQGLFLKQYGAQMLFLLQVYHKVSTFLFPAFLTHTLSSTG